MGIVISAVKLVWRANTGHPNACLPCILNPTLTSKNNSSCDLPSKRTLITLWIYTAYHSAYSHKQRWTAVGYHALAYSSIVLADSVMFLITLSVILWNGSWCHIIKSCICVLTILFECIIGKTSNISMILPDLISLSTASGMNASFAPVVSCDVRTVMRYLYCRLKWTSTNTVTAL